MELSKKFYRENYNIFSDTRYCLWDSVKEFSKEFTEDSNVLDAGCGNGKNIKYFNNKCKIVGIDNCQGLIELCKEKGFEVFEADIKNIPFENNIFDYVMSIAVIHHFDKEIDRLSAINEMIRVLKPGGKLLFTVWALESDEYSIKKKFKLGDNIVKFKESDRYYYIYDKSSFLEFCSKINNCTINIFWERGNWVCILEKI